MSKYFDIKPPTPSKQTSTHTKSASSTNKKHQSKSNILLFGIFIIVAIFIFSYFNNSNQTYKELTPTSSDNSIKDLGQTVDPSASTQGVTTPSATPEPTISQSSSTNTSSDSNNVNIIVLNGAQTSGVADSAKKTLENNNISVAQIGNTENSYNESIIYYTDQNLEIAKKIKETLSSYNPTLISDNTLADNTKITVVIGAK